MKISRLFLELQLVFMKKMENKKSLFTALLWTLYRSNLITKFAILNFPISLPGIQNSQMLSLGKHISHFSSRLAALTVCHHKAKPCPIDLFAVSDAILLGAQTQQDKRVTACHSNAKPCPIDLFAVSDAILLGAQTQQDKRVTASHSNAKPCPIHLFMVSDAILLGAQTQQKLRKSMRKFKHRFPILKF